MRNKISIEKVNNIRELYKEGIKLQSIADIVGVGLSTVKLYIKDLTGNRKIKRTPEQIKKDNIKYVTNRRKKIKEMSIDYKGGKCSICKYDKCKGALEFHHLDPNMKDFTIGNKGYTKSWEIVKKELDKCILVCANCHREIHEEINSGE